MSNKKLRVVSPNHRDEMVFFSPGDFELPDSNKPQGVAEKPKVIKAPKIIVDKVVAPSPPPKIVKQKIAAAATNDSATEAASLCPYTDGRCSKARREAGGLSELSRIAGAHSSRYHSLKEQCYSQELLRAAKSTTKRIYKNRDKSGGLCAKGVRQAINQAGIYGGSLGNAIDYNARGKLIAIGFKNLISEYPNPAKAPPGAVLVFAGPKTDIYLRTGNMGRKNHHGEYVGHVTIKGDDGYFYTDGKTAVPAIGWPGDRKSRRLVGVYLMQECTGSCSAKMRNKCGS